VSIICLVVAFSQRPKKHRFDPENPNDSDMYVYGEFVQASIMGRHWRIRPQRMGLVRRVLVRIFSELIGAL
jgi:hypothetical protein